jgi:hypothetical protein
MPETAIIGKLQRVAELADELAGRVHAGAVLDDNDLIPHRRHSLDVGVSAQLAMLADAMIVRLQATLDSLAEKRSGRSAAVSLSTRRVAPKRPAAVPVQGQRLY